MVDVADVTSQPGLSPIIVSYQGMRKSLAIILAVAILGASGFYLNHSSSNNSGSLAGNSTKSTSSNAGKSYHDGTYTGDSVDTPYGPVEIAVVVNGGKITNVNFLNMPSDFGRSSQITQDSEPLLKQTTLAKQSANIEFVSGATSTSYGYQQSLQAALDKAASAVFTKPVQSLS